MKNLFAIEKLVEAFESKALSRRELVTSIAALMRGLPAQMARFHKPHKVKRSTMCRSRSRMWSVPRSFIRLYSDSTL